MSHQMPNFAPALREEIICLAARSCVGDLSQTGLPTLGLS